MYMFAINPYHFCHLKLNSITHLITYNWRKSDEITQTLCQCQGAQLILWEHQFHQKLGLSNSWSQGRGDQAESWRTYITLWEGFIFHPHPKTLKKWVGVEDFYKWRILLGIHGCFQEMGTKTTFSSCLAPNLGDGKTWTSGSSVIG